MRNLLRFTPAIFLALSSALGAQRGRLHSPWDNHKVELTRAAYTCPAPPPFATTMQISAYYIDSKASVADPAKLAAFQKASEASTHLSQWAALAADSYLATGSRAAAACVYSLLQAAAKANAWDGQMADFNGVYIQNWLLSAVAISYLKVRPSRLGTPAQDAVIQKWFALLAKRVRDYFDQEVRRIGPANENNHLYWAGLAVAAAGIADNNAADFHWGVTAYHMGLELIQPDGSLTAEMNRGQMAMHYNLYALGPLIMLAELGEANGLHLYAEQNGAIHRLVKFCTAAMENPALIEARVGVKQLVWTPYSGGDIGWAVPYVKRFPNAKLSALLAKAQWVRYTTWGGAPPD